MTRSELSPAPIFEPRSGVHQPSLMSQQSSPEAEASLPSRTRDGVGFQSYPEQVRGYQKADPLLARARAENIRFAGEACLRCIARYEATNAPSDLSRLSAALLNLHKMIQAARLSQDFRAERAKGNLREPLSGALQVLSKLLAHCSKLGQDDAGGDRARSVFERAVNLLRHPPRDKARREAELLIGSIRELLVTATWLEAPIGLWHPPGLDPRSEPTHPSQIYPDQATSTQTAQRFPEALQHHLAAEVALHEGCAAAAVRELIAAARILTLGPEHGENAAVAVALIYIADAIRGSGGEEAFFRGVGSGRTPAAASNLLAHQDLVPQLYATAALQAHRLLGAGDPLAGAILNRANDVLRERGLHDWAAGLTEDSIAGRAKDSRSTPEIRYVGFLLSDVELLLDCVQAPSALRRCTPLKTEAR